MPSAEIWPARTCAARVIVSNDVRSVSAEASGSMSEPTPDCDGCGDAAVFSPVAVIPSSLNFFAL
jgi:hypothetical protein